MEKRFYTKEFGDILNAVWQPEKTHFRRCRRYIVSQRKFQLCRVRDRRAQRER